MSKYNVYATEIVTYQATVEASSSEEAMKIANETDQEWKDIEGDNFEIYAADKVDDE